MGKIIAFIMLVALIATPIGTFFFLSAHTELAFAPQPPTIGANTPVTVHVANPHGLRRFTAILEQNGARTTIMETRSPADRMKFWLAQFPPQDIHFNAGSKEAPNLKEGKARHRRGSAIERFPRCHRHDLSRRRCSSSPSLRFSRWLSALHQSGRLGDGALDAVGLLERSGSARGQRTRIAAFPLAGSAAQRLALFAFPWDTPADTAPVVFARNSAGTEATARFWFKVFPKKFRMRDLAIDDKFLDKVVNQIDPNGSGDLADALPQDQRRNAPRQQQDAGGSAS